MLSSTAFRSPSTGSSPRASPGRSRCARRSRSSRTGRPSPRTSPAVSSCTTWGHAPRSSGSTARHRSGGSRSRRGRTISSRPSRSPTTGWSPASPAADPPPQEAAQSSERDRMVRDRLPREPSRLAHVVPRCEATRRRRHPVDEREQREPLRPVAVEGEIEEPCLADPHPQLLSQLSTQARPGMLPRLEESTGHVDRKSTRLNSSHGYISYAVFCLKKKKKYTSMRQDHENTYLYRAYPRPRCCSHVH